MAFWSIVFTVFMAFWSFAVYSTGNMNVSPYSINFHFGLKLYLLSSLLYPLHIILSLENYRVCKRGPAYILSWYTFIRLITFNSRDVLRICAGHKREHRNDYDDVRMQLSRRIFCEFAQIS